MHLGRTGISGRWKYTSGCLRKINIVAKKYDSIILKEQIVDKEKLAEYYKKADIFIFPTYHEGFPRVLYEAMTFGLPIITTSISGTSFLMKNCKNCLKIPVKDVKALKEKVIYLCENENIRETIGQNSVKIMEEFYKERQNCSHAKQVFEMFKNNF